MKLPGNFGIDQGSEIAETGQERFDPVRREIVENTLLPEEVDRDACRQDGDADNDIPRVCPIFTAQGSFRSGGLLHVRSGFPEFVLRLTGDGKILVYFT